MTDRMRQMFGGWLPARIETYNSSTNRASVQILILDDYEDEEGARLTEPFPVLMNVPVAWPCIAGKFAFRIDLSKGDECMVMLAARPVSKFLKTGGMTDPEDDRHHDLNDACILPYRLSAGGTDATPQIHITSTDVQIGGNNKLVTRDEFLNHGHPVIATGATSPTLGPVSTSPAPTSSSSFSGTQILKGG